MLLTLMPTWSMTSLTAGLRAVIVVHIVAESTTGADIGGLHDVALRRFSAPSRPSSPPIGRSFHHGPPGDNRKMNGIRHFLRNFTDSAVKAHLRSQIDATAAPALTKNEIELVRFIREGTFDWGAFLAARAGNDELS
jgi:hypothetical protein